MFTIEDIFNNPWLLMKDSGEIWEPKAIEALVPKNSFWEITPMLRGSHAGQGSVIRELNLIGNRTGRMIQYHPGDGHHGVEPYWKVSSPKGGIVHVGPQFPKP